MRTPAVVVLLAAAALAAAPLPAHAQVRHRHPEPQRWTELQAEAEAAPLFASDEPLVLTLRTDIDWLRDERDDEEEVDGTLAFPGPDGGRMETAVEVRTRGNFRRSRRNCNFPPLRLDLPRGAMEGTVFEGQDKLKLVTPCHDGRDSYQHYIYHEYLAYRLLQLLTPVSFRVRLVEITYEDTAGKYETRTKHGFLIEDEAAMAARNGGVVEEVDGRFNPGLTDAQYSVLMALFQYMIGNTDWSSMEFHNVKLIHTRDDRYFTVPYDFDFSGAVDARYAAPDPSLPIRDVRQRLFRGFCFPHVRDRARWAAFFGERRDAMEALYTGFTLLPEKERREAVEYLEGFWRTLEDEGRYRREVVERCRG